MRESGGMSQDTRVAVCLEQMTLEQKCALLSGATEFTTYAYPSLGIPELRFADGPSGLRKQAGAADHLGLNPSEPATCFPLSCTVAMSWDPSVAERAGAAMGEEAAAQGVNVLLGPGLNVKRNPLCGRNFEYYSEDPLLAGSMAAGFVRGVQSAGVSACPKHFAVNSQETRRMTSDSVLDERTLREIYLAGFEHVVREARPRTIMTSYNLINGTYANENEHLLQTILRDEWGYDGAVVTDWGGSNDHVAGVAAGSTFEMPNSGASSVYELIRAVELGALARETLDRRVSEALELIFSTIDAVSASPGDFDKEAHHALARELASSCAVLLKNEGDILPCAAGTRVAVIGDFAQTPRYQGAGSSAVNATRVDSFLDILRAEADFDLVGYAAGFERSGASNDALQAEAVELAQRADVVLMCLGLAEIQESEGIDRRDMRLHENQVQALHAVAEVNPHVVVLLSAGAPVELPWIDDAQALVLLGLGGQAGAGAAFDVICGRVNPSGKLSETWPLRYEDVPTADTYPAQGRVAAYRESLYVGYRYFDTVEAPVAFPFGFGLSYTHFSYADPAIDVCGTDGVPQSISCVVGNEGAVAGAEVVQAYVAHPGRGVFGPARQLAGFAKVPLDAGAHERVVVSLDPHAFEYWNVLTNRWEIEGGTYEVYLAASSRDMRLMCRVELAGTGAPNPYAELDLMPYETGEVYAVDDATFERLLGHAVPTERVSIDRNMTLGELGRGRSPIGWILGSVISRLYRKSLASDEPDLNIAFIYNMPLRAIAKMTGGMVSMGMVDAIVMELRGFWIIGIIRLIIEFALNLVRRSRLSWSLVDDDNPVS